mmetsp:Transcript_35773/g.65167  ORF Transcript_35773/g.65167 Transcript_35773/m.65167 type:complete len:110 (-) Transcript_35773:342-671(-)
MAKAISNMFKKITPAKNSSNWRLVTNCAMRVCGIRAFRCVEMKLFINPPTDSVAWLAIPVPDFAVGVPVPRLTDMLLAKLLLGSTLFLASTLLMLPSVWDERKSRGGSN